MAAHILTAERLRELLNYDSDLGIFTRRIKNGKRDNVGDVAGWLGVRGYRAICLDYRTYAEHRLAWLYVYGHWPADQIDHINRIKTDNRICNLRDVSSAINKQNINTARSHNKSGFIGAVWSKSSGKWLARIIVDGKQIHGGTFSTAEAASEEYFRMKKKFHEGCILEV